MSSPLESEDFLLIGTIVAPFGVHGQVKLRAFTDNPEHVQKRIRTVYIGKRFSPYQLLNVFQHKPGLLILTLKGIATREDAEDLRGADVHIPESEAAPLAAGEYFLHQLYNLHVETIDGQTIGQVREVIETGANNVVVVTRPNQSDALIPMIHDVVQEIDFAGGRLIIRVIEGLLSE